MSNCFSLRLPLQWFKDDSGTVQSVKINEKRETKEEISTIEKQKAEPIVIEELKEELIVEKCASKELIIKQDLEKQLVGEKSSIEETQIEKSTDETNLRTQTISNENFQKGANIIEVKKPTISSESLNFEESSSYSEHSDSDCKMTDHKSPRTPLVKEMDQKSSQRFYAKTKKQEPDQNLIDNVLKIRYFKMNQIFNEPSKAIPLPRRNGTINVTFSERAFPTPARESSHIEEQKVC